MPSDLESVAAMEAHAERRIDSHQRLMESLTGALGRPRSIYVILLSIAAWIASNLGMVAAGLEPFDAPPFLWLQGTVGLAALLMTTLVLITQNRQSRDDRERSHLDLHVNLLSEQKASKLIALLEELRRDLPMVRDRVDGEAEAMMTEPIDPVAALEALRGEAPEDE